MIPLILLLAFPQPQNPELAAVQKSEAARTEVIARCAPAVCSVMGMDEPGGGSGVVFHPAGFVLTNYHVVGEADDQKKARPGLPLPGAEATPPKLLADPPAPPAEVLQRWATEHPEATDAERTRFVEQWQAEWREENHPKGGGLYRNKKVGLPDGQLYEAVVLGIDPGSDLAVLRLLPKTPGQTWPSCRLGDSDALLVGEMVFAMGNPFLLATDFTPTVTFGIVSGTHRYQEGQGNRILVYPDCIQVDAPVNPGNSGGPLFNEAGEVVGINGRISIGDRGRVNVGVGFAIASNQIKNFLGDLLAGRHAEHGTLDMSAWYMNSPHEEKKRRGVFVQQMFKDSVVAAAGASLGDEITQFNGREVRSANQLATLVGVLPAGTWVSFGFRPALGDNGYGEERTVFVRMAALDTGSSRSIKADTARLASRAERRLATAAILANCGTGEPSAEGVALEFTRPDGGTDRVLRRGEELRLEAAGLALVRPGTGDPFRLADGKAVPATADERARLDREWTANPFLWRGEARRERLAQSMLVGGVHVLGRPAVRLALPGDGELEAWLFLDGTPAGYSFRDPLRKAKVECHVVAFQDSGLESMRVIVDGKFEAGWRSSALACTAPDEALFRRP